MPSSSCTVTPAGAAEPCRIRTARSASSKERGTSEGAVTTPPTPIEPV